MSEYQEFLQERNRIDFLLQEGYTITNVTENLSGAFVNFSKKDLEGKNEILHIVTPEGRKYFSAFLLEQNKEGA